jgi:anaerobic magnesium-protoporphyrin IX monomethyl ester cyclase
MTPNRPSTPHPGAAGPLPDAVFVNPAFDYPIIKDKGVFYTKKWPNLSLAYCASIAERNGLRTEIIDAHVERTGPAGVADRVRGIPWIFVSTSPLDRWQCPVNNIANVYAVLAAIRAAAPTARLCVIGPHGTTLPEKILAETPIDVVILGEPESTVADLTAGKRLEDIEGIAYREAGAVVVKPRTTFMDLDDLPLPAFHLLPMDKYYFDFLGRKFTVLEGSRGCPFRCTFCYKDMYGPFRAKSSARLVSELELAYERFGVRNVYFADLTFTLDKGLVRDLCDAILERGWKLRWACQTRLDVMDEALLTKMRDAGCRLIEVGVESGTETIVRGTNKYIPPKTITDGIRTIRRLGMESVAFMLLGLPGETREDMLRSVRLARAIAPTYVAFNVVVPYTETRDRALFDPAAERAVFFPARWPGHSEKALDAMFRRAFLSYYLRPRTAITLLKHPRSSFHKIGLLWAAVRAGRAAD